MASAVYAPKSGKALVHKAVLDEVERRLIDSLGSRVAGKGESPDGFPTRHLFTPGIYAREITMPAGSVITSKVHKTEHPFLVSSGRCWVYTDTCEWVEIRAPHYGVTKRGTRRLLVIAEDTVWTTFHLNTDDERDIATIESRIIEEYENPLLGKVEL